MGNQRRHRAHCRRPPTAVKTLLRALLAVGAVAAAVVVVAVTVRAFLLLDQEAPAGMPTAADADGIAAVDTPADAVEERSAPSKLAGSTESVDAHDIVHGTTPEGVRYTVHGRGEAALGEGKVTLAAVGDQIGTDNSLPLAERYGGGTGSGVYDFSPFYREVAPVVRQHDLRYINQETVMAGGEGGQPYSGYPVFNTPDTAADAIADNGFNLVNFATNHTYDLGTFGVERSHEVWARHPQLLVGGSYLAQEDRETVHLIERGGLTFAFLAYTYGDNTYGEGSNMPNDHYCCPFDKEAMEADVRRAQQVADAVIVSMHWGTEYVSEPNDQQLDYARLLADLEVNLVLGTHAHIMQPVRYVAGRSGNVVPVVFGLGDFISGWTLTDTILSGLFTCEFVRSAEGGVEVLNPVWHPLIEWFDGGDVYVRLLEDMGEAEIAANTRTEDVGDDLSYLRWKIDSVGMEVPVAW